MKFHLINRYGNAHRMVNTERECDELLKSGYTLVEESEPEADLDKMTVEQLDKYAAEKNIDLSGCKNKAEKLEKIKAVAN